jgi:hypothetical protein
MVLSPGVYIITGGLVNNGNYNITGTGVTLYFACGDGSNRPVACASGQAGTGANMQSTGGISVQAPTSGTYQGVAIFMDRQNTAIIQLQSSAPLPVKGTIYGAAGTVAFTSNGFTNPLQSGIVIGKLDVQSSQNMTINFDPAQNSPSFAWARNRDLVR